MKRIKTCILIATAILVTTSCTNVADEVSHAAYKYAFALANYNIDDAAQYCTIETRESTLQYASQLLEQVPTEYIESDTPGEIEIKDVSITSDTTATIAYHKKTPIKDFDGTLNMVKRDGLWLAHDPMPTTDSDSDDEPQMVADTVTLYGKKIQLFHTVPNTSEK